MAIGDITYLAHGAGTWSQTYATMRVKELLSDTFSNAFFKVIDRAAVGNVGGQQYANAAVVDYTRELKTNMRGDEVVIDKSAQIHGVPTTGTLRNNEEKLAFATQTLSIYRQRHAIGYERFGNEKAHFDIEAKITEVYKPWLAHHKDRRIFDAMISGQTAAWANSPKSRASAAAIDANMASVGMTVADLDRIAVTLKARNAKPLFFTSTANGGQNPGYAVVLPPDQYDNLMHESVMKSAVFLSVAPGPDHPLRSGAMIKYNNLWVFELQGDFRDGGSPLQPMAKLQADVGTASGASVVFVGVSGSAAALTKYFTSSGFLTIWDMDSDKAERIKYTAKGDYYFTLTSKRVAADRTSHLAAASMIAQDVSNIIAFGREVVAKVETADPAWIYELMDYSEVRGKGLRWIEGYAALTDTAGRTDGLYLTQAGYNKDIVYF